MEGSGDFQPPTASPPQDLLPSFLVTLLVPLAVAAVLCVVLGHLMCLHRWAQASVQEPIAEHSSLLTLLVCHLVTLEVFPPALRWDCSQSVPGV